MINNKLNNYSLKELKNLCKKNNIRNYSKLNKVDLISLIKKNKKNKKLNIVSTKQVGGLSDDIIYKSYIIFDVILDLMQTLSNESYNIRKDSSNIFDKLRKALKNQRDFIVKFFSGNFDLNYVISISSIFKDLSGLLKYINQNDFKELLLMSCNLMRLIILRKYISTTEFFKNYDYLSEIKKVLKMNNRIESIWLKKLILILLAQIDLFSTDDFIYKDTINTMIDKKLDSIINSLKDEKYTFILGNFPFYNLINSIICTIQILIVKNIDFQNVLIYNFEIISYILNLEIYKFIFPSDFLKTPDLNLATMIYYIFYYIWNYFNINPLVYLDKKNSELHINNKKNKFKEEIIPLSNVTIKNVKKELEFQVENIENKEEQTKKKSWFK